jgi:hypothetical protein
MVLYLTYDRWSLIPEDYRNVVLITRAIFNAHFLALQFLNPLPAQHPECWCVALQLLLGQSRQFYDLIRSRVVRKVQSVFGLQFPAKAVNPRSQVEKVGRIGRTKE